jgi:hypothetical protein
VAIRKGVLIVVRFEYNAAECHQVVEDPAVIPQYAKNASSIPLEQEVLGLVFYL